MFHELLLIKAEGRRGLDSLGRDLHLPVGL